MRTLRAETGTAIILITHDLGVVAELADDVVVMYAGRIVERATVVALFAEPQHPYTVGLLGSIPRLDIEQDRLAAIEGQVPNPLALAGLVSVCISLSLGAPIGLLAGYVGGWVDALISRITDAMLACPFLILAIALAAFLGPSLTNAMIAIGISATPVFIRLTRAQVLAVKVEDYVEAARAVGNSHLRIALRHILPNVVAPLIVQATLAIAAAVIAEASLSFLGLGQQPPAPSWGSMLNTAKNYIDNAPWMAVWPGLSIFLLVLSFNLVGDGLRDALDPRHR
ncbi:MAG TPA: oligopeptide/dipeptide ABC transporter ATP-binding protein [Casimicrobiaceae bacterium]|jgi:peptide/nickel transport system permease protein